MEMFKVAFHELGVANEVKLFNSAGPFLQYMRTSEEKMFLILCDINMPLIDGFELRNLLTEDPNLSVLTIPFLFFSTSSLSSTVNKAYAGRIQGYFVKPSTFEDLKILFKSIIEYWGTSQHPVVA